MMTMTATLQDVQAVYSGPEGRLWELIMGEQIHIGGLQSSIALAEAADIKTGTRGIDLCSCAGAGMKFLIRFRHAAHMTGIDATKKMVDLGKKRCAEEGFTNVDLILGDATDTKLDPAKADFIWGEDAWCYVEDKSALVAEAARLVKPGGTIAFTDWLHGESITSEEADRFHAFMKFPNMETLDGYKALLESNGCQVKVARDTGRFAPCINLYLQMVSMQLTYDALRIIGFDQEMMQAIAGEMDFTRQLAEAGKLMQGMIVARKL